MNFKSNHNTLKVLYLTGPLISKEICLSKRGIRKRSFFNSAMASMKKYSIEVYYLELQSWGLMNRFVQTLKTLFVLNRYNIILATTGAGLLLGLVRFFLHWEKPYLILVSWRVEKKKSILYPFFKQIYRRNVDNIICVSSAQKNIFAKFLNISKNRIIYVPLGIDTDFFKPEKNIISAEDLILCVGDADRDDKTLIKAVRNLPVQLTRVSDESKIFDFLKILQKDRSRFSNLKEKFVLLHAVSDLKLKELYAKSTMIVVPIHKHSNQPAGLTTLLEAMAMGKPVIVTKGLITEDYVINHETGIVIPPGDVDQIKNAILYLLDNNLERKRIGNNARKWVEDNFTIERSTEKLGHLLRSILI